LDRRYSWFTAGAAATAAESLEDVHWPVVVVVVVVVVFCPTLVVILSQMERRIGKGKVRKRIKLNCFFEESS